MSAPAKDDLAAANIGGSHRVADRFFYAAFVVIGGTYALLLVLLVLADVLYVFQLDTRVVGDAEEAAAHPMVAALQKPEIRYSIGLTLISCTVAAILSVLTAVPVAYLLARVPFRGRNLVEAIFDIPIVLPPLVVGLSLLILFQFLPFSLASRWVVYQIPAVILAQYTVAAAFAVRTMRATFDQTDARAENVALTLGCSRWQAFWKVVVPEVRNGMLTALTLAWARSLGEFGPLLIFAGATRNKTEVLATTVFLELSIGDLEAAVAVSLIMIVAALSVLIAARVWGRGRILL
ncbi:MAG: ABC transporter permease [Opitutales bacterium]